MGTVDSMLGAGAELFRNLEAFNGQLCETPPILSGRQEASMARHDMVRAARHVERYSEHIRGGIDRKVDMTVGPRLTLRSTPDFKALGITDKKQQREIRDKLETLFYEWGYDRRLLCDAEGHYDFGGMMWAAMRSLTGPDAEAALIVHTDHKRAKIYKHKWSTFVQLLDPDRIETPAHKVGLQHIQDGKVLDKYGRMVGFYCRKYHPSEAALTPEALDYELIPRETEKGRPVGVHWFVKTRPTQLRGVSTLVTILKQSGMLDKFDDAYLGAATINQVLATYIQSEGTTKQVAANLAPSGEGDVVSGQWGMFSKKVEYYNKVKMRVGNSRVPILPPGDEIKMSAVNRAINDPTFFRNGFLRQFASAIGISFEQLSKNFSDANYSAARAALLDIWQGVMRMRTWFGAHVAAPIYQAVMEEAFDRGYFDVPEGVPGFDEARAAWTSCEWTGPGFPQIDPEKEAKAAKSLIDLKLESRTEIAARMGRDIGDVWNEIEAEEQDARERGIDLRSPQQVAADAQEEANTQEADEAGAKKAQPKPRTQKVQRDGDGDGEINEGED